MDLSLLEQSVFGTVIRRTDHDYTAAREALLFNKRAPARAPLAIVRAASVGDVQAAVRFAAAEGLHISARGGGHNWSGIALQNGIVLDLSALKHIRIDAASRTAEVGPGVRNGDAARAFAAHGFAFPLGHCASVPLSGYLLGGGFGWNSGQWGIACFSVESVDVVLADGELRRASDTENPDIFWAVRGGGPEFFGVVTAYRLRLQPLPRAITTSTWTYRLDRAAEVEAWMRNAMASGVPNVEFTAVFSGAPPHLADRTRRTATAVATVFADNASEAHETLARIGASAPAGALELHENMATPFDALYEIIAGFFPVGYRYAADSFWAPAHADSFLARLAVETAQAPAPRSFSLGVVLPPQRGPLPDGAFSMAGAAFGCAYAIWDDAASDNTNMDWLRQTSDRIAPLSIGAYVGEADLDHPARLQQCFSPSAWAGLKALQSVYDPKRMFGAHRSITVPLQSAA